MSESESEDSGPGQREVAYRIFATEFDAADYSYSESDEERAPNYVITPTGARVNRMFVVGVLTEVEQVSDDVLRGRIVDPTGAFVLYAGQYQPDQMAFLDRADPPMFVAVTGKARTFQPEDGDQTYTSIRPESISTVDADTRDRWVVQTAEQTIDRVAHCATALSLDVRGDALTETLETHGVSESLAAGIPLALEHYDTSPAYLSALRETALDAVRVVTGDRDEAEPVALAPDDQGTADLSAIADADVEAVSSEEGAESTTATSDSEPLESDSTDSEPAGTATTSAVDTDAEPEQPEDSPEIGEPTTGQSAERTTEGTTPSGHTPSAESGAEQATETDSSEPQTEPVESEPEPTTAPTASESQLADSASAGMTEDPSSTETPAVDTADASAQTDDDIGDFDPGEFELDDDEREEIEDEYGTEFQSGTEVEEPGEADIETPNPEELAEAEPNAETQSDTTDDAETVEPTTESETAGTEPASEPPATESKEPDSVESEPVSETVESTAETETESQSDESDATETPDSGQSEPAEDVDLVDAVVETMGELDSGDGASRPTLIDTVAERHGASPDDVEAAIQEALMDGRCYEPDDTTLKPI